jgi:hypothetical protein
MANGKTDNAKLKALFLEYFSKLPIQKLAAEFIGKSEDTITDWKKADPEFAYQIAKAKSEWALNNSSQVKSKEWLLERIMNEHFADKKKVEHDLTAELEKALDRISKLLP